MLRNTFERKSQRTSNESLDGQGVVIEEAPWSTAAESSSGGFETNQPSMIGRRKSLMQPIADAKLFKK